MKNLLRNYFLRIKIKISDVEVIAVTGGKSSDLKDVFKGIPIVKVNEIEAIGYGAKHLYNISDSKFVVVSCGTGTACVSFINDKFSHMGGISVGGGTLQGLSNLIIGKKNAEEINNLALEGNKDNLDSLIGEVVNEIGSYTQKLQLLILQKQDMVMIFQIMTLAHLYQTWLEKLLEQFRI